MSLCSYISPPNCLPLLLSKSKPATVVSSTAVGPLKIRACTDVPDFLSADWLESRKKRPFGPRLNFSAEEAVRYQLDALKFNDQPRPDYGIEVMYRFAGFDPFERSTYFGPFFDLGQFERFRRIFHHSTYRVLLGHKERNITSSLFVEEVKKAFESWVKLLIFHLFLSLSAKCYVVPGGRIDLSSGFGYEGIALKKKQYSNSQWFRELVVHGMGIG